MFPAHVPYQGQIKPCTYHLHTLFLIVETTWVPGKTHGASNRFPVWIIKVPRHQGMPRLTSTTEHRCRFQDLYSLAKWDVTALRTAAFTAAILPGFLSWNLMCRICLNALLLTARTLRLLISPAENTECLNCCKNACLGHFRCFESCRAEIKCWECFLSDLLNSSSSQSWIQFLAYFKKISCF